MANYCDYNMRVRGTKENVYKFHKRMRDYDSPNHLFRMFAADIYDEYDNEDGTTTIDIGGYCAWSIESCCRASGYSNGVDLFEVNTRELELKLECWSSEEGMCFQEHYLYDNGECQINDSVDWYVYCFDESEQTFEEFLKSNNIKNKTKEDLQDDLLYVGGFKDYDEFRI